MNALRNKVQLIGRLGKDAETITFDDGKVKARFPVATNETFRNSEGEKVERTQWHDVVAWGGLAEVAGQYLRINRRLFKQSVLDVEVGPSFLSNDFQRSNEISLRDF